MFIVPIEPMKPMTFSEDGNAPAKKPKAGPFQNVLDSAVTALNETQNASRDDAFRLSLGDADDIGQIMINTLKAESMIQTAVQVTARAVNAYKEIMNIQV